MRATNKSEGTHICVKIMHWDNISWTLWRPEAAVIKNGLRLALVQFLQTKVSFCQNLSWYYSGQFFFFFVLQDWKKNIHVGEHKNNWDAIQLSNTQPRHKCIERQCLYTGNFTFDFFVVVVDSLKLTFKKNIK